jgi:8-oxo-dGTP diphosphatase
MSKALKKRYSYEYPRPALTVDLAIVTRSAPLRILLIRRKHDPFAGTWALPGGFVDEGETLEEAARRELREETGLDVDDLQQVQTFGDPGRDPRGWTVAVAFLARVDSKAITPQAADDAAEVGWHPFSKLPPLAFDHARIVEVVRQRVQPRGRR